ncbi:MAG TPA: AsmA-like C-terminal region-containing protein [Alphaproteobacteria bacterium]|nr:AsmA-like C-terminal region-containing protein [Alphaproteobacteria bacterium]
MAGIFLVGRADLGASGGTYLSHLIGRKVTIGSLRIHPGQTITIEISDASVANLRGGTKPAMITVSRLTAEFPLRTLLLGPLTVSKLKVEGGYILLEHESDGTPNWRFKTATRNIAPDRPGRLELPVILDAHFRDVTINYRSPTGRSLPTVIEDGQLTTERRDAPVSLTVKGSYRATPIVLVADLASFAVLHRGEVPFPAKIQLQTVGNQLNFEGTFIDPLNVEGAAGKLTLHAPALVELANGAGIAGAPDIAVDITGQLTRNADVTKIDNGHGTIAGQTFDGGLELREGTPPQPDALKLEAGFQKLDSETIVKRPSGASPNQGQSNGISLVMDPAPTTLLDIHVTAGHFVYGGIAADDFGITAKIGAGALSVDEVAFGIAGGTARSKISVVNNKDNKGVVNFEGSLAGVDANQVGALLGWAPLPVDGPVTGRAIGSMIGADMSEARRTNRVFAVLAMDMGTIERDIVRKASTDIRMLFGSDTGVRKLRCLLAVLNLRDGKGTIGPARIKSTAGTIAGSGTYDSVHDTMDLVIGAQSKSWFSLDVPVRIAGPVTHFSVMPAFGTSRQLNDIRLPDDLPQALKDIATASPCLSH